MIEDTPERWSRISTLFEAALQRPLEARSAFLDNACGPDVDLRRRVADLLAAADRAGGFLEAPLHSQAGPLLQRLAEALPPAPQEPSAGETGEEPTHSLAPGTYAAESIGPYRLVRKIGEGGMGEVWKAEQEAPIRRQVAIKLIKAGMDTKQVVARFEAERQALALMDHPGIAKVFEAGETPRGLPYFAMEYVAGEPITDYCDRARLATQARLELFAQVCAGVQHAHQKGVIHRDLKPSNILVGVQDGRPAPKIIDFGVAKAMSQRLTERTMLTETGAWIGTPEYMSPEQAETTGLDVDTRTDVYALGVVLYELLTGTLPFESRALRQAGVEEVRRRIREVEPPPPSTRVRTLGGRSAEAARLRSTDPKRLVSRLKGDLDWIVMKALEKDRTRRYGSPGDLAADVARHLDHQPVVAGPPSTAYRARKYVRRHRLGVAIASVATLGLLVFGVGMGEQARRVARERDRAERVSDFLVKLFEVSNPSEARGNSITAREVLDRGAQNLDSELRDQPEVHGKMLETIGNVYLNLGLLTQSESLLKQAAALQERSFGADARATLKTRGLLARSIERQGRYPEAESLILEVWKAQRESLGKEDPDTLWSLSLRGFICNRLGRFKEAEAIDREVVEARRRLFGADHPETLESMHALVADYEREGRYAEAEEIGRQVLATRRRILGDDHPRTLWSMNNLASAVQKAGRRAEAEPLYREAFEGMRRVLGVDHPDTLYVEDNLAGVLAEQGRSDEAEKVYLEVLEARRRVHGPEHLKTMATLNNLAIIWMDQKRYADAENAYRQALGAFRAAAPEHPNTFYMMTNLAGACAAQGRADEAEQISRQAVVGATRVFGPAHPVTWGVMVEEACMELLLGRRAAALQSIRQAIEAGYDDAAALANDPDLAALRGDPEFENLVGQARQRAAAQAAAPH